jgi:hypothetical protein
MHSGLSFTGEFTSGETSWAPLAQMARAAARRVDVHRLVFEGAFWVSAPMEDPKALPGLGKDQIIAMQAGPGEFLCGSIGWRSSRPPRSSDELWFGSRGRARDHQSTAVERN